MEIKVMSRQQAMESRMEAEPYAHISIRSPGTARLEVSPDAHLKGILYLEFDNVDIKGPGEVPISDEQALEIWDFAKLMQTVVSVLVCQCEAGISRSAGVAAAVSKILTDDDWVYFSGGKYSPNRLVYQKILKALNKSWREVCRPRGDLDLRGSWARPRPQLG